MHIIAILSLVTLACLAGYSVVRQATPALHMPLIAATSAIGSVVIVGAVIAAAESSHPIARYLGLAGILLASVNIVGGFAVTERMLARHRKAERE